MPAGTDDASVMLLVDDMVVVDEMGDGNHNRRGLEPDEQYTLAKDSNLGNNTCRGLEPDKTEGQWAVLTIRCG